MTQLSIIDILSNFIENHHLSSLDLKLLYDDDAINNKYPLKFKQNYDFLQSKLDILILVYHHVKLLFNDVQLIHKSSYLNHLWYFWIPLALELAKKRKQQNYPFTIGILGGQGTGKSTLTQILPVIWQCLNISSVGISLDDLYKTYEERQKLLKIDSRLIWRGPPGTHDVELGIKVLNQLRHGYYPVEIPRFDKSLYSGSGDRIENELLTNYIGQKRRSQIDIIILEGWFVGVQPVAEEKFIYPPYPIITKEDQKFALDCNQRLKEYLPLWEILDYLMILNPEDYRFSLQWRKIAEHKMINQGKAGMNDEQIEQFVHYFWKALHPQIYIQPMIKNSWLTDLVINIDYDHNVTKIIRPNLTQ
ncbi:D-glycerate 3-kinase [Geminocystis sp. NIES-3708]|uniref:glycerate kinase n=1 Tax=Geminocystis sp. NIES-3708 TaxID=1615909 RepID=UPI0005FC3E17|nr:glycerate kinase [Geminocystis sp. NIES-3708]BAQ61171.1 D-glycerate 3-kinase [Geminocystis sp. NIES-3708]